MKSGIRSSVIYGVLLFFLSVLCLPFFLAGCGSVRRPVFKFSENNSSVPLTESMLYNRCLTWRPADQAKVSLNPPRFSWPYEPTIMLTDGEDVTGLPIRQYRFQIAEDPDFSNILFEIERTDFNFYNAIAPLPMGKNIYWRVGYYDPDDHTGLEWQKVKSFYLESSAVTWNRSGLAEPDFVSDQHPRIIYTADRIARLRALAKTNPHCRSIFQQTIERADEALKTDWFNNFPRTDTILREDLCRMYKDIPETREPYLMIIDRLMSVAFAYVLTGEEKYLPVVDRLVSVASYGPEGITRPEGMKGVGGRARPDNVEINEDLSLFYDWFYNMMTPEQRKVVLESLRWRTEYIMYSYSWRRGKGTRVSPSSVAVAGSSHPYENVNYTLPAGIAAYEEGGVFHDTYRFAVHYLTGLNNCFGPEDAWNEGPGYGLSKLQWMMYATCYYDMSLKNANLGLNPFLETIGEFFTRVAVLGLPHLSFGNIGIRETYYIGNRMASYRKLAYLTSNKRFLKSWQDAIRRMEQLGYSADKKYSRPWIEYALPLLYDEPDRQPETPKGRLFSDGGWATAASLYPGELDNYKDAVGIIFHARPRGAFNHSFFGDNNFQLYAYGRNITHSGGSTQNEDRHAHNSMAQNVVLVDGLGQAQPEHTSIRNFRLKLFKPYAARIARFADRGDVQYFKGEAANAYVQFPYRYRAFWGHLGDGENNPYDERDLSYLTRADRHVLFVDGRYFVMLDDLEVSDKKPEGSLFSWLYHVLQDVPLEWEPGRQRFSYTIEDVTTVVQIIGKDIPLEFENRKKDQGLINPLTGEDYTGWVKPIENYDKNYTGPYPDKVTHNIWITNAEPRKKMRFLTVIYPYRKGTAPPKIERIDDLTVKVSCGEKDETVTFDPAARPQADIQVEL